MKLRKVLSCVLIFTLLLGAFPTASFAAQDSWQPKNNEPFIFVHGLNGWGSDEGINSLIPYWGATTGDLMVFLNKNGYECYSASVGPISSAWDRACELYAQIIGSTVDYGVAHSEKNGHDRFGRTYYSALVPDWGELDENGKIQKIHLIGHSFGGTTIRMLVHLLTYGSPEEIAATESNDISGLFTGGKKDWVKSVTTVSTPHNSSNIYYPLKYFGIYDVVRIFSYLYAGIMGRSFLNGRFVDFHLEQFGLTDIPGEGGADNLLAAIYRAETNNEDTCAYDLSTKGTAELNDMLEITDSIYYFSYSFSTTEKLPVIGVEFPKLNTNPVIYLTSLIMVFMPEFKDEYTQVVYDDNWRSNDALINTMSATYPFDEAHKDFDETFEKGIWNVMPVREGDHGSAIGLFADEETVQSYYLELSDMLCNLPD